MKLNTLSSLTLLAGLAFTSCSAGTTSTTTQTENSLQDTIGHPEELLNWKLGSQAYTFRLFTFAEALDKIDSADLRFVEAFPGQVVGAGNEEQFTYTLSKEGRDLVRNLLTERGITLHAFGVVNGKDAEEWEQIFAFAQDMGVKIINCEPKAEHLDIVSALCEKYDIRAAIHNHPEPSRYWKPEVVLEALEGRSPKMGAAVDVGHWMRSGLDPVACLKELEGKIIHAHFKDLNAFGDKKAHDVHWGTGKLPINEVIAELKRQNFDGMLSAEYEYNWENNQPDVAQSVKNLRQLLSKSAN
ncbi:sugar phosphate isomerase/epimerase family protein [Sphingobacterium sp. FBM7-1]|uniref:sugar phosphate isomerase/epimerase family protein n=1 Tax=Sphingobacterium sp. FBM7-1 TaxID=2886688 RepID=UPI001D0FABFF|nr:sugar phosphate isomerase/epimerase [Sphingobacterium sp. FBM7-1]MCC2598559.1 sugar phosphate isomerase/epimerase [Sphingobacterium sp. FBM7-1]